MLCCVGKASGELRFPTGELQVFWVDIYRCANDKFIGGINFAKQPDMNFTGSTTKMGSLITFKVKGANANFALGAERVFVTAVSEQIFELSESASTVLD